MHSYSSVERALASFFNVGEQHLPSFRARIRNLQKLGLKPIAPGRGNRVLYTTNDACDLALALSLTELGVNPSTAAMLIPAGTMEKRPDKRCGYYIYSPSTYTYPMEYAFFITASEIKRRLPRTERTITINIKLMMYFIEGNLVPGSGETDVDP